MSVHVSSAVWRVRLHSTEKIVLLKLADCCDDDGRNAWPSVETIAEACGVSVRTVAYILDKLRKAGIISQQEAAHQHLSTTYELHPEVGEQIPPRRRRPRPSSTAKSAPLKRQSALQVTKASTANGDKVSPATFTRPGLQPIADKPSVEPSEVDPPFEPIPPNPPLSRGAQRALAGSGRRRDVEALEAESGDNRYYRGKYGAILRGRLEEGERDAV